MIYKVPHDLTHPLTVPIYDQLNPTTTIMLNHSRPECSQESLLGTFSNLQIMRVDMTARTSKVHKELEVKVKSLSHVWLSNPMDYSPPGSPVHGIFQARVLKWVAISFSRGSSQPRNQTWVSHVASRRFTIWATMELRPKLFSKKVNKWVRHSLRMLRLQDQI